MELGGLSNLEITAALDRLTGNERQVVLEILYHLIELERRGIFRDLGYSSLFDYCARKLKYSPSSAYRRISAARCLRDNPQLGDLLVQGKVTLCSITTASRSIKNEVTKVEDIVGRSQREVEALVAKSEPVPNKPKEIIKPLVVHEPLPLLESPPIARIQIRFSVSKESFQQYEEVKAQLSNKLGQDLSVEAVFTKLIELYLKPKQRKSKIKSSRTRYIPRSVKRGVYERDGGQCSFVSADGTKCTERHYLQFDHVKPYAMGGLSEAENLRLLCPKHNGLMAEKCFGKETTRRHSRNHSTGDKIWFSQR